MEDIRAAKAFRPLPLARPKRKREIPMSVMTHGQLPVSASSAQGLTPQQKATIRKILRRAGRLLFGAAVMAAVVCAVVGLKTFVVMSRFPHIW
jgi:hypothetical protein